MKNNISYMDFYNNLKNLKGYSKEQLKNEFLSSVNKRDYRKAEIDEIIDYLYKNI